MNAKEKMEKAIELLEEVKQSGYWPFVSPAPCSTEVKIKDGIYQALQGLNKAIFWHEQMFDRTGRNPEKCVSSKIVTIK